VVFRTGSPGTATGPRRTLLVRSPGIPRRAEHHQQRQVLGDAGEAACLARRHEDDRPGRHRSLAAVGIDDRAPADHHVVERTFAWISKHRRTVRDYEHLPSSHEAMILWAMTALMARRLAPITH
jgi:hypothetical protein